MLKHKKYLPDFIFGSIDGLVTTFAIVSGVVGASLSSSIILILGFANLFADGFSMAVSNYLSSKSGQDLNHDMSGRKPIYAGFVTFLAFVLIGFVPLIAFVFNFGKNSFLVSIILTGIAFALVGYFKGLITNKNKLFSATETLLIGAIAAIIAYLIGYWLSGFGIK
ncbi:MAG TPA: VIT1/CCC1 transporter family protein [Candidatus Paceibacterota bacterium]|nr:VIT1/CCC1 transporter family protein [Candidatus Paceibacterota bacterium]HMP19240.1 VIT1/CCC1 transporter family protein [Candidatus Paceibacterota bacterium]HMP85388.1 VIT1/CCC1 transporter family protein [Candidatus Paceibacterota bacterium]